MTSFVECLPCLVASWALINLSGQPSLYLFLTLVEPRTVRKYDWQNLTWSLHSFINILYLSRKLLSNLSWGHHRYREMNWWKGWCRLYRWRRPNHMGICERDCSAWVPCLFFQDTTDADQQASDQVAHPGKASRSHTYFATDMVSYINLLLKTQKIKLMIGEHNDIPKNPMPHWSRMVIHLPYLIVLSTKATCRFDHPMLTI